MPFRKWRASISAEMFLVYIEQNLAHPTPRQGDVVIVDNPVSHKVARVQEAIERKGRATALSAGVTVRTEPDLDGLRRA